MIGVKPEKAGDVLSVIRETDTGKDAGIIGEVTTDYIER